MDWNGIWSGVLSNILYGLLIVGGGVMFAYLKKKQSQWLPMFTWGLGGAALILACILMWKGLMAIPEKHVSITPQNVEANIRTWLDDFHLSTKSDSNPAAHFVLLATLSNGDGVYIVRLHDLEHYLVFKSNIGISPDHLSIIRSMGKADYDQFVAETSLELARAKVNFALSGSPVTNIAIESTLPITENLTEADVMKSIDEMDAAMVLVRNSVALRVTTYQVNRKSK
jgi:hypothetical protein